MNTIEDKPVKPKVLLVDDDPRICAALAGALLGEGFDVVFEDNGDDAIRAFRDGLFDIALLDLRMPGRNGWETFAQLKWSRPLLPVIVITALPDQCPRALALGVGALLEKPLDLPILLETIRRLLNEPLSAQFARIAGKSPSLYTPALADTWKGNSGHGWIQ